MAAAAALRSLTQQQQESLLSSWSVSHSIEMAATAQDITFFCMAGRKGLETAESILL